MQKRNRKLLILMDKKKKHEDYYEYCKGQCGYGPYCSECIKEKNRKWEESLLKKLREREHTEDDAP